MNKEFVLTSKEREQLFTFDLDNKYPVLRLQSALWNIKPKNQHRSVFVDIYMDTYDYEGCLFEMVSDKENYKLIIYTND